MRAQACGRRRGASSEASAGTPRALWREPSAPAEAVRKPPPGAAPPPHWLLLAGIAAIMLLQVLLPPLPLLPQMPWKSHPSPVRIPPAEPGRVGAAPAQALRARLLSPASWAHALAATAAASLARQLRMVLSRHGCVRKHCGVSELAHVSMRALRAQVAVLLRTGAAPGPGADVQVLHERLDALAQSLARLGGTV